LTVKFKTKDAAVHFCEKQGWPYFVQEPQVAAFLPKSYANNYVHYRAPLSGLTSQADRGLQRTSFDTCIRSSGRRRALSMDLKYSAQLNKDVPSSGLQMPSRLARPPIKRL
jgi:hypothetical protein